MLIPKLAETKEDDRATFVLYVLAMVIFVICSAYFYLEHDFIPSVFLPGGEL
jgi:hypothetical protein